MKRIALLVLLISVAPYSNQPKDIDQMQEQSAITQSGLKFEKFDFKIRTVQGEPQVMRSSRSGSPPTTRPREPESNKNVNQRMSEMGDLERQRKQEVYTFRPWVQRFVFRVQMKNESTKTIKRFAWRYQPQTHNGEIVGKDFVCASDMTPGTLQDFKVLSPIPHQRVVSSSDAGQPARPLTPAVTDLSINFVEFKDGTRWESPTWNSASLSQTDLRKLDQGKCALL